MNLVFRRGFTKIEFLIVMGILAALGLATYLGIQNSQKLARDFQRKDDLRSIVNALTAYRTDHGVYPLSDSAGGGRIKACSCKDTEKADFCEWSGKGPREFCDGKNTVYMRQIPWDPGGVTQYCYWSDGSFFKLYAELENKGDPERLNKEEVCNNLKYNYGIFSPNLEK